MSSCHRIYLDRFLNRAVVNIHGDVLDVGGRRVNKKGSFCPPEYRMKSWRYLNIDPEAAPDILCDAEAIPLPEASVDGVVLSEVMEHLERPEQVLRELARILRPGGHGIVTMPFMYPLHADPHDFQRWTQEKLRREFVAAGFEVVSIEPLGGAISAIHTLLLNLPWRSNPSLPMRLLASLAGRTVNLALWLDRRVPEASSHITSGWGAVVRKPVAASAASAEQ